MAPYIRKARHRRFKRFRYSLKFLTWLERQALRVGMPARTLYNDYLVNRLLSFEQVEGLPNVQASSDFNPALSAAYFDGTDYAQGAVATITARGTAGATFASAGTGAEVINGTRGFNFSAGKYLLNSSGLGAVMRAHRFQVIMDMTINNLAAAPYLLNLGPATENGRLQIQALANGRVRVQLRNASNTPIATHDAATIIQDGVPFTLSVSIENNLLSVDWGPGGVTSPISDEVAFNVSGANVSYDRVAIGALHANGAGSGMANMILESFIVMEIAA